MEKVLFDKITSGEIIEDKELESKKRIRITFYNIPRIDEHLVLLNRNKEIYEIIQKITFDNQ